MLGLPLFENPCPCGYFGDPKRACRRNPRQVENYRQRISGPLLDRIDLHVEVPLINYKELSSTATGESSDLLEQAMEHLNFSARAHDRILKVARTLADLEESQNIRSPHILESIQYRTLDRSLQL